MLKDTLPEFLVRMNPWEGSFGDARELRRRQSAVFRLWRARPDSEPVQKVSIKASRVSSRWRLSSRKASRY